MEPCRISLGERSTRLTLEAHLRALNLSTVAVAELQLPQLSPDVRVRAKIGCANPTRRETVVSVF